LGLKRLRITPRCTKETCTVPSCTSTTGLTEAEILKKLKRKELFVDSTFDISSHGELKRPNEFSGSAKPELFLDGAQASDIEQGALGDCWFLSAVSVVATRPELIERLFVSDSHGEEHGIYTIAFFKNDYWHHIVIDDRIPCKPNGGPKYARCKSRNEIWLPLLEKAYAKMHGSYEALDGGVVNDALVDLVGGAPGKHKWTRGQTTYEFDKDLWKHMVAYRNRGSLMGCYQIDISNNKERKAGEEPQLDNGLVMDHAYGVLDVRYVDRKRLVRLRNPWGHREWRGAWSDNSKEWQTYPRIKRLLNFKPADDGSFWMAFEDFMANFENLDVCQVFPDSWAGKRISASWTGKPFEYGGRFWTASSQFNLKVHRPTNMLVLMTQPDKRIGRFTGKSNHALIAMMIAKCPKASYKFEEIARPGDFVDCISAGRECHKDLKLQKGLYKIVCMYADADNVPASFRVTVWSDEDVELEGSKKVHMVRSGAVLKLKRDESEYQQGESDEDEEVPAPADAAAAAAIPSAPSLETKKKQEAKMDKPKPVEKDNNWWHPTDLGETEENLWEYCCQWMPCWACVESVCTCSCAEGCFCYNCLHKTWICDCCAGWNVYECLRGTCCTCKLVQPTKCYRCVHGCCECYCLLWSKKCIGCHDCVMDHCSCYCLNVQCSKRGCLCQKTCYKQSKPNPVKMGH